MRTPGDGAAEEAAACGSWLRASDGLIAGIHHALNNRMAALGAVGQVLEADLAGHPLSGAMSGELHRLESTAGLLRLLVHGEGPEPVQVETAVQEASQLFEMHHSLRDLRLETEIAAGLYPLWIDPAALLRALVVMLAIAGRRARDGVRIVRLAASGDAKTVQIRVEATSSSGTAETEGGEGDLAGIEPEGAAGLLDRWGGELTMEERDGTLLLNATLPTLPEARSREAAASS